MSLSKYPAKVAKARGYKNYYHYLQSEHWQQFKDSYQKSGRPLQCKDCHGDKYEFYHLNPQTISRETFDDVILLCLKCYTSRRRVKKLKKVLPNPINLPRYDCEKCKNDGRLSNVCICR